MVDSMVKKKKHIEMDNNLNPHDPMTAFGYIVVSSLLAAIGWITVKDAQFFITFMASVVSCVAGLMAIRYYYFATNEKKKNLNP